MMQAFHFYHAHRLHRRFSDFWLYELSLWFHTFARALVSIFIPILMLKSGYEISAVVLFYLFFNILDTPFNFLAREIIKRAGARIAIIASTFFTIGFFWLLLGVSEPTWSLLIKLAFLAAAYDSLYWVAHFYLFIETGGSSEDAGRSTGTMHAVRKTALLLGPLFGAGLLIFFDQAALLYVAIGGFLLSLVPLAYLEDFPDKPAERTLSFKEFFADPSGKRAVFSRVFYGVHIAVEDVLFPVFIFLIFGTIESVAIIPLLLSLAAVAAAIFIGREKPKLREATLIIGALSITALWLVRIIADDPTILYATVLAVSIGAYFVTIPLDSIIYEHGRRVGDTLSASTYRNVASMAPRIVLYGALALLLNVFEPSFAIAAVCLAALAVVHLLPLTRLFGARM